MKKGVLFGLVLVLLLASCGPQQKDFPVDDYQPSVISQEKVPARPVINKTPYDYEEDEPEEDEQPVPRKKVPELSTPVEEYRLKIGYGVVGLNQSLGRKAPEFTKYEFPELLKSRNVQGGVDPVTGKYEQFLRLKGGKVMFTGDEQDNVQDYLVYRDGEPILEYEFVFSDGSFIDFIDEEIHFLGRRYVIEDATKEDVVFRDVESGSQLVLGGGSVMVNGEVFEDTDSRMTGDALFFIAKADAEIEGDDLFISRGSSLQEELDETTVLTDKVDIRYEGLIEVPHTRIDFVNQGDEISLMIDEPYRDESYIPLGVLEGSGWRLGDEEGMLHVKESSNKDNHTIKIDDYFVLTSTKVSPSNLYMWHKRNNTARVSIALQYKDITPSSNKIELASREGFVIEAFYNGTPGDDAKGRIPFAGRSFEFYIGNESEGYPLAIDLNSDGWVSGSIVDYAFRDGVVDLPSRQAFNNPVNISIKLLNYGPSGMKEEKAIIRVNPGSEFTYSFLSDRELFDLDNDNDLAVSEFGTHFLLVNEEGDGYEEIRIDHPLEQRLAEIVVESE